VSFESAHAMVAGSYSDRDNTYDSLGMCVIEGLNIMGVVTAQRIVARISASHPADGSEPSITPHGSSIQGLRIGGRKPVLDLAIDTFGKFDTMKSVRDAYRSDKDGFRKEFDSLSLVNRKDEVPKRVQSYFSNFEQASEEIPERDGIISCSLLRGIDKLGSEHAFFGHTIHVKGFGVIRLAEFKIMQKERRLVMLQVDLGSTPQGVMAAGTAAGNGSGW